MKNKVILTSGVILSSLFFVNIANAATIGEVGKTTGDVTFEVDDKKEGGKPTDPSQGGGDTEISNPKDKDGKEDGSSTSGALRFEWLPNFHFGAQKISSTNEKYSAIWAKEATVEGQKVENYPQFVQVADETGNPDVEWNATLKMTDVDKFQFKDGDKVNVLENTYIYLYNVQTTNSVKEVSDVLAANPLLDIKEESPLLVNKDGVLLGKTKEKGASNGTKTSFIFADTASYNSTDGSLGMDADSLNDSVKLETPSKDIKVASKTYTANLTWELTDGK